MHFEIKTVIRLVYNTVAIAKIQMSYLTKVRYNETRNAPTDSIVISLKKFLIAFFLSFPFQQIPTPSALIDEKRFCEAMNSVGRFEKISFEIVGVT